MLQNPYYEEYQKLPDDLEFMVPGRPIQKLRFDRQTYKDHRHEMVTKYSWSVPTNDVVCALAKSDPRIVEIGAGTGYWAWLLTQAGADVLAFDHHPPSRRNLNNWRHNKVWHPVRKGNIKDADKHSDRTLLLSWPPYSNDMALRCLTTYKGDRFIFIGEHSGGCTANDAFFDYLIKYWTLDAEYDLPQWDGLHDGVWVYER